MCLARRSSWVAAAIRTREALVAALVFVHRAGTVSAQRLILRKLDLRQTRACRKVGSQMDRAQLPRERRDLRGDPIDRLCVGAPRLEVRIELAFADNDSLAERDRARSRCRWQSMQHM